MTCPRCYHDGEPGPAKLIRHGLASDVVRRVQECLGCGHTLVDEEATLQDWQKAARVDRATFRRESP